MCFPRSASSESHFENSNKSSRSHRERDHVVICIFIRVHSTIWNEISYLKMLFLNIFVVGMFFATIIFVFKEFGRISEWNSIILVEMCVESCF